MTTEPPRSPAEQRLDRNWGELLQELRVVQTGVQLLTGFLLTLPFQARFAALTPGQRRLYLGVLTLSTVATVLLVAPVPAHRLLFRQHERELLVTLGHRCALVGCALLGFAVAGVAVLMFQLVESDTAGWLAGGGLLATMLLLWVVLPLRGRKHEREVNVGRTSP